MRILIRKTLRRWLDDGTLARLKSAEFNARRRLVRALPTIDEARFEHILRVGLALAPGDDVFIHASASMMRLSFGVERAYEIIRQCVGERANVFVPTFPRTSSAAFLAMPAPFDRHLEPSGMGALSEYVRCLPGAVRSNHPTKSIAGVGPDVASLLAGHAESSYAFDAGSPYRRLVDKDVKVVGIGAPMSYLTFVHVFEDCNRATFPFEVYLPTPFSKLIVDDAGQRVSKQYFAHDLGLVSKANPERFVRRHLALSAYRLHRHFVTPFFVVRARALYDAIGRALPNETIYY